MKLPIVWRSRLDKVTKALETSEGINKVMQLELDYLRVENQELRKDLERARRNDMPKDPKTGKFKKK